MAAGARWVDGPRLDLAAVGDNGQRVRIGWHLDFFAIFIYFRIFFLHANNISIRT